MLEIPIDIPLAPELEEETVFGDATSKPGEIIEGGFVATVGDQPIPIRVLKLYENAGLKPDSKLYEGFEAWLVPHRVGIIRKRGLAEPVAVGIEVEYITDGATCCVASLFPSFEFTTMGTLSAHAKLAGEISPTGIITPLASELTSVLSTGNSAEKLRFAASAGAQVAFEFSLTVATPYISAIGVGSSRCQWRFSRHAEPLFGKDLETWAVVVLPKRKRSLTHRVRFYMETRTLFVPTRRESQWLNLTCILN